MGQLILFFQPDCHLCDEAVGVLHAMGLGDSYQEVDIETDLELLKRYGILVPVLQRSDTDAELYWPFDPVKVEAFLKVAQ